MKIKKFIKIVFVETQTNKNSEVENEISCMTNYEEIRLGQVTDNNILPSF